MQVTGVGGGAAVVDRGVGSLKSEDFFRLLVTEMQNQDPLEPSKTADMIGQVSQIRSIELNGQLSHTLEALANQNRFSGASGLIGRYVSATITDAQGAEQLVEGLVTSVQFDANGQAVLELDTGQSVLAEQVDRVTTLEQRERELSALLGGEATSSAAPTPETAGAAKSVAATSKAPSGGGLLSWLGL